MYLPMKLDCGERIVEALALIDSGAGGTFIDQNFAQTLKVPWNKLENRILAYNVDGTVRGIPDSP